MKKFIIFILVLSLLAVPVAADSMYSDVGQSYFNVLDFAYPNGGTSHRVNVTNGGTISFDFEGTYPFSYFDILVYATGTSISSVTLDGNNLTIIDLGNRLFRMYGLFPRKSYTSLDLLFNTTGTVGLTFLQFEAYPNFSSPAGTTGQFTWERFTSEIEQGTREQTAFRETVFINKPAYTNTIYDSATIPWKVYLTADDWNKFDSITFLCGTEMSIDSLVVNSDLGQLPFNVSEFLIGNDESNINAKLFSVTVDISGYPRNSSQDPTLSIMLSQDASIPGSFYLYEVTGNIVTEYPNAVTYWLRRLFLYSNNWWSALYDFLGDIGGYINTGFTNLGESISFNFQSLQSYLTTKFDSVSSWITNQTTSIVNSITMLRTNLGGKLDNILSAIKADSISNNQAADDFNNSVETQAQELEDLSDTMNSVERPDISDVMLDVSDLVDPNQFTMSTVGFSTLLGMDIFTRIILMALTFALIGFVLFGKR